MLDNDAIGRFCCRSDLKALANSDSVALTRSAVEADDDGAVEARSGATVLFILP
jgi:serine/threonine protein kinase HipA of HipAB toxin-antitoxin module